MPHMQPQDCPNGDSCCDGCPVSVECSWEWIGRGEVRVTYSIRNANQASWIVEFTGDPATPITLDANGDADGSFDYTLQPNALGEVWGANIYVSAQGECDRTCLADPRCENKELIAPFCQRTTNSPGEYETEDIVFADPRVAQYAISGFQGALAPFNGTYTVSVETAYGQCIGQVFQEIEVYRPSPASAWMARLRIGYGDAESVGSLGGGFGTVRSTMELVTPFGILVTTGKQIFFQAEPAGIVRAFATTCAECEEPPVGGNGTGLVFGQTCYNFFKYEVGDAVEGEVGSPASYPYPPEVVAALNGGDPDQLQATLTLI